MNFYPLATSNSVILLSEIPLQALFEIDEIFITILKQSSPEIFDTLTSINKHSYSFGTENLHSVYLHFFKNLDIVPPIEKSKGKYKEEYIIYQKNLCTEVFALSCLRNSPLAEYLNLNSERMTWDEVMLLRQWILASDTLRIWRYIAKVFLEPFETYTEKKAAQFYIDKAESFLAWRQEKAGKVNYLTKLLCANKKLTHLPKEIGLFTNLKVINLRNNGLRELPTEIGLLTLLRHLYLHDNEITQLPSEIGNFTELKKLFLSNNKLESIPEELGRCEKLMILDLSNNPLISRPKTLSALKNCRILDREK